MKNVGTRASKIEERTVFGIFVRLLAIFIVLAEESGEFCCFWGDNKDAEKRESKFPRLSFSYMLHRIRDL